MNLILSALHWAGLFFAALDAFFALVILLVAPTSLLGKLRYIGLYHANILSAMIANLLAPVLPLFAKPQIGFCDNGSAMRVEPRLPDWLGWFMTPDNSLYGDEGWRTLHCPDYQSYWGMAKWLMRNPAYGFDTGVLGAHLPRGSGLSCTGDLRVRDGAGGIAGVFSAQATTPDGKSYWSWLWIKPVTATRCLHWEFGWALQVFAQYPVELGKNNTAQFKFSPRFANWK